MVCIYRLCSIFWFTHDVRTAHSLPRTLVLSFAHLSSNYGVDRLFFGLPAACYAFSFPFARVYFCVLPAYAAPHDTPRTRLLVPTFWQLPCAPTYVAYATALHTPHTHTTARRTYALARTLWRYLHLPPPAGLVRGSSRFLPFSPPHCHAEHRLPSVRYTHLCTRAPFNITYCLHYCLLFLPFRLLRYIQFVSLVRATPSSCCLVYVGSRAALRMRFLFFAVWCGSGYDASSRGFPGSHAFMAFATIHAI